MHCKDHKHEFGKYELNNDLGSIIASEWVAKCKNCSAAYVQVRINGHVYWECEIDLEEEDL